VEIDCELLERYMRKFYGYGNEAAETLFIGLEEGGRETVESFATILHKWQLRGERDLEDLQEYSRLFPDTYGYFKDPPKPQPTWNGLIRILLKSQGKSIAEHAVTSFQTQLLGAPNGDHCLLELMPLPARRRTDWPYAKLSRCFGYLAERDTYEREWLVLRRERICDIVRKKSRKAVVFYGTSHEYLTTWQFIAGQPLAWDPGLKLYRSRAEKPLFVAVRHPSRYTKDEFYEGIGDFIFRVTQ